MFCSSPNKIFLEKKKKRKKPISNKPVPPHPSPFPACGVALSSSPPPSVWLQINQRAPAASAGQPPKLICSSRRFGPASAAGVLYPACFPLLFFFSSRFLFRPRVEDEASAACTFCSWNGKI